jgi:hypothetical protein
MHVMTVNLSSGSLDQATEFDASVGGARSLNWTSDGGHLVWGISRRGDEWRTDVFWVPASGGIPEQIWSLGEGHYGAYFDLSPDGKQIAYTTFAQEGEVWVMENLREVLRAEAGG